MLCFDFVLYNLFCKIYKIFRRYNEKICKITALFLLALPFISQTMQTLSEGKDWWFIN